jgi:hypothetical protein
MSANSPGSLLFQFYIFLASSHGIYITLHYFYVCLSSEWEGGIISSSCSSATNTEAEIFRLADCRSLMSPAATTVFGIILSFECLLFGLFTLVMCIGQLWAIYHDQTVSAELRECHFSYL